MPASRQRRAFTLIELLVVVAIIALLISLLLPGLQRAREQSRQAVCMSNVKQCALAFTLYAQDDSKSQIPGSLREGAMNLDWCGRANDTFLNAPAGRYKTPFETSVLYRYLAEVDRVFECPSSRREGNRWFDYTMPIRFSGARIDRTPPKLKYFEDPNRVQFTERWMLGLPIVIEEDTMYYNHQGVLRGVSGYDDGAWAGNDQFTVRHNGLCNLGFLDGTVRTFKSPKGPNGEDAEELRDLKAAYFRIVGTGRDFIINANAQGNFGWINNPAFVQNLDQ